MARKKQHSEHHEEHADETWLIPYSDLLTLLLALFIVLFASSSLDKKKGEMIQEAFAAAFNVLSPDQASGTLVSFLEDAKGLDLGEKVGLGSDSKGALLEIADISLFDAGSAEVTKDGVALLKKIAVLLRDYRYRRFRIVVEGHTDDTYESSTNYPSKWELSAGRAANVVKVLISTGISSERFRAVGMADIAPKYPNFNPYGEPIIENRKKNRRVVIRIEP